ncbi:hypothetical protein CS542_08075 [Pedobacter sp. IW39]|nr:hypothetical protein CS542_08075 [Pedobacter sp. IW39]
MITSSDVTNSEEVIRLLLVKEKYQRIDGIIQCRCYLDSLIINKTQQEVHEVLKLRLPGLEIWMRLLK